MTGRRLVAALALVALVATAACADESPETTQPGSTLGDTSSSGSSTSASDPSTTGTTSDPTTTELTLAKTSDLSVAAVRRGGVPKKGETVQVDFVVKNLGPAPATGVVLDVTGAEQVVHGGQACPEGSCALGDLGIGGSTTVTASVVAADEPHQVVASVHGSPADPKDGNQSAAVTIRADSATVLVTTRLDVTPALISFRAGEVGAFVSGLHARLTNEHGIPVRDGLVRFSISGQPACEGRTDANGEVGCTTSNVPPALLTSLSYRATFVGSDQYATSTAVGQLLG